MEYALLIYQGALPGSDAWKALSDEEQRQVYTDYGALNQTPGVSPGLPLGLPEKARTVRVENDKTVETEGPHLGGSGAIGGYLVFEADDIDAAVRLAARIPAARLGGAIEVRPVERYW